MTFQQEKWRHENDIFAAYVAKFGIDSARLEKGKIYVLFRTIFQYHKTYFCNL